MSYATTSTPSTFPPPAQSPSLTDLKQSLSGILEQSGTLQEIRARLRADIYQSLAGNTHSELQPLRPQLSHQNLLINELIREYLTYSQYHHTQSVLVSESNMPEQPAFTHQFLADQLNIQEHHTTSDHQPLPLLYSVLALLQSKQLTNTNRQPLQQQTSAKQTGSQLRIVGGLPRT